MISGREYNYAIVYSEADREVTVSYATTENEAQSKLAVAEDWFRTTKPDALETLRIEAFE